MCPLVLAGHLVLVNRKSVWKESNVSKFLHRFITMSGEPGGREYPETGVVRKEKKCGQMKSKVLL